MPCLIKIESVVLDTKSKWEKITYGQTIRQTDRQQTNNDQKEYLQLSALVNKKAIFKTQYHFQESTADGSC